MKNKKLLNSESHCNESSLTNLEPRVLKCVKGKMSPLSYKTSFFYLFSGSITQITQDKIQCRWPILNYEEVLLWLLVSRASRKNVAREMYIQEIRRG